MYAYIAGKIAEKNDLSVTIDVNGVGYHIEVSLNTYSKIEQLETAKLYTYLYVREDAQILYGFINKFEKQLFIKLISVSGIGTNTARMMLSSLQPNEIINAIVTENEVTLKSIKGIGLKTAKRLIVELKETLQKMNTTGQVISDNLGNTQNNQALSALLTLGFSRNNSEKALKTALSENPNPDSVESLIKIALKNL